MIGLFVKIPYHAQLRAAEPRLAAELSKAVDGIVADFSASRQATEESFLLTFDEASRPCRLRAAEAARRLVPQLSALGPRLHGWFIILDAGSAGADETLHAAKQLWYGTDAEGVYVSARSRAYFADYFVPNPSAPGVEGRPCIPAVDALRLKGILSTESLAAELPSASIEKLIDFLGELGIGARKDTITLALGPGRSAPLCLHAALKRLYGEAASRFLLLRASVSGCSPYGPIAEGLLPLTLPTDGSGPGGLLSGAERGLLEELAPMLDFLRRSPYRGDCSGQFRTRLRLCSSAALRFYARKMRSCEMPAFVILEGIERFPEPSLELLRAIVSENLSEEGISLIGAGTEAPQGWSGEQLRVIEVAGPTASAMAKTALRVAEEMKKPELAGGLALAASGDPLRLRLAARVLSIGRSVSPTTSTEKLGVLALESFPREYAEFLLALRYTEAVLTDERMEEFLDDIGYVSGVRSSVYEALALLGLVTREARPWIISAQATSRIEDALPDAGAALREDFAQRLLRLRAENKIFPSSALFGRMAKGGVFGAGITAAELAFAVDCITVDTIYGSAGEGKKAGKKEASSPLDPLAAFARAYSSRDREASDASVQALEEAARGLATRGVAAGGQLASSAATLCRAQVEYAEGEVQSSALKAKNALIALHGQGAERLESRAHRILGLCALAQSQAQEGADYLTNAYEIACAIDDPLERILAAASEAGADLVLGDLGRATTRAEQADEAATEAFRADWESASAFIKGRICLEIGRFSEAEDCFGRVRSLARVYGQAEAARRAEVWTGRAASCKGERVRGREILRRFEEDPEALWFLGELEYWEGDYPAAVRAAEKAAGLVPQLGFSPADVFDWSSGFASLEGRAIGYFAKRSYLGDQILAFKEFASGLAEPGEAALGCAARLDSMAREDKLAAIHPSAHIYLFYRYLVLERSTPSSMDGSAALSKSFKALQLRSLRMGEAALKDGFMYASPWNRALLDAARARKLL